MEAAPYANQRVLLSDSERQGERRPISEAALRRRDGREELEDHGVVLVLIMELELGLGVEVSLLLLGVVQAERDF